MNAAEAPYPPFITSFLAPNQNFGGKVKFCVCAPNFTSLPGRHRRQLFVKQKAALAKAQRWCHFILFHGNDDSLGMSHPHHRTAFGVLPSNNTSTISREGSFDMCFWRDDGQ